MNIYILILIAFLSINVTVVQSQIYYSIPDTNVIWNIYNSYVSNPLNVNYKWKVGIIGDTIINMKHYSKLYQSQDTIFNLNNSSYYGAIREENKIVYVVNSEGNIDEERIVYDFNIEIGDTFLTGDNYYNYYNHAIVQEIDSVILLDNTIHKRIVFDGYPENYFWIEGVGSGKGILFPIIPFTTDGYEPLLSCMKYNDTVSYLNNNICNSCFCTFEMVNDLIENKTEYNIYPNPTTGIININTESVEQIQIYDLKGNLIKLSYKNNIDICTEAKGIYILKVITKKRVILSKIILE